MLLLLLSDVNVDDDIPIQFFNLHHIAFSSSFWVKRSYCLVFNLDVIVIDK